VAAFRAPLEEYSRERVPLQWALTQENLGLALQALGEKELSTDRMDQAIAAFRTALEVFEQAGASYNIEKARRNLALAEAALARLRQANPAD
jgi:tetratricopeptide (TPR) repeat protein